MDTQEIRELVEDATRHHGAPWKRVHTSDGGFYGVTDRNGAVVAGSPAVTALIAQAPTLIPELLDRLERAEARVKLLESGIVADLVITSVHSANAIGATVSGIADELLKLGYDGLMNRLDAMRRQRDGYRNQLRKTEQQVARVREMHERIPVVVNGRWEIDHCKFCYEQDFSSDDAVWPCPTIRALDGDTRG